MFCRYSKYSTGKFGKRYDHLKRIMITVPYLPVPVPFKQIVLVAPQTLGYIGQ